MSEGVSFVVPVRNGARWLLEVLDAIAEQRDGRPFQVIVIDDGSEDGSAALLQPLARRGDIHLLAGAGRGAAAALNQGIRAARFPIVCQVDQDVVLRPGWMSTLVGGLQDPVVAAVQGYYESHPGASASARAMNRDLEQRYTALLRESRAHEAGDVDHVCTGNVAYRTAALRAVGLFDESLGYGYDNDISYRLKAAGYRLVLCPAARSIHRWRDGLGGYLRQQYGFGYGRLDLIAKHPTRLAGDRVSPWLMMAHAPLLATALATAAGAALGPPPLARPLALAGSGMVVALVLERTLAGLRAAWRFRDPVPLLFPVLHLLRDLVWVWAIAVWGSRRLLRRASRPGHSMRARSPGRQTIASDGAVAAPPVDRRRRPRVLCAIPAHNEATNLAAVVAELRDCCPDLDVLVVDDGSTDDTTRVLETLGVPWLRFPERLGIGSGVRAALRYAERQGYEITVRMDGDGQHRALDVVRLIAPIQSGEADVTLGSRYTTPSSTERRGWRLLRRTLAMCLSRLTDHPVTDPTSGFCAFGRRATRLVAEHHPSGYAEPELRLFLQRNGLRTAEVPVQPRRRLSGRTSLSAARVTGAAARALLAMLIVPLRPTIGDVGD